MLYVIATQNKTKIGYSKHPLKRLSQLQTGHSEKLKLIKVWKVGKVKEKFFHKMLARFRSRANSEWFNLSGEEVKNLIDETLKS